MFDRLRHHSFLLAGAGLGLAFAPSPAQDGPVTKTIAGRAQVAQDAGRQDPRAERYLEDLASRVRQSPDDSVLLARYGLALIKSGRTEEGLTALTRATVKAPQEPEVLLLNAKGLMRAGHVEDAVSQAMKAAESPLASNALIAEGYSVAGFARWRMGNISAAENLLRSSIEHDESRPEAFFNLGMLLMSTSRRAEGVGYLKRAAQVAPNDIKVLKVLGELFERQGQVDQALEYYERIARLVPASHEMQAHVGELYFVAGRPAQAVDYLEQAVSLDPSNIEYHIAYASSLAQLGRLDDARRQAQIAEDLGANVSAVRALIEKQSGSQ